MKKITIPTLLMIFCWGPALSYASNSEINTELSTKQKVINFTFDEGTQSFSIIPGPNQTATTVIYVNKYRPSSHGAVPADSVRVVCNGTPTIVNPGNSFTCHTPENKQSSLAIEPGFFKNGAEGFVISAE